MKVKGAIFDMDGTLIDSMPIWDDLSYNLLKANGIEPKRDLREKVSSMYLRESSQYVIDEYGLDMTVDEVINHIDSMVRDFYLNSVPPKEDVKPFLERMKAAGVKMCVATATQRDFAVPALERNGMLDYFDTILTCEEVGSNKQSPLVFERALELLGTKKEETLVFEDSLHAIKTAVNAGFPVAAIYDKSSQKNAETIKSLSSYYFYRYSELDGVLG